VPWEAEGDGVKFSGHLTDLMTLIMNAYAEDIDSGAVVASSGVYVTATAIVLREILLATLADQPDAEEFLARATESLSESEDGTVTMRAFQLLDDVAEHFETVAYEQWLADPAVRAAIADVADNSFSE
jgi:voltage-gated potassium channel Kch